VVDPPVTYLLLKIGFTLVPHHHGCPGVSTEDHLLHIYFPKMRASYFPQLAVSSIFLIAYLEGALAQEAASEPEVGVYDWGCGEL
jgi:hypothetical protein